MRRSPSVSSPSRDSLAAAVVAILFAAFAFNAASRVRADALCCADDAYFATIARNLAEGRGYQAAELTAVGGMAGIEYSADEATSVVFEPHIGTGPVLILPVSLAIRWLGPLYWLPGAVTLALCLILLLALAAAIRRQLGSGSPWLVASTLFLVTTQLVMLEAQQYWSVMLGEIPAALLAILGLVTAAGAPPSWRRALVAGLWIGLAAQTKLLALLAAPVACVAIALGAYRGARGDASWRAATVATVLVALGTLAPLALFEVWKIGLLGWDGFLDTMAQEIAFFVEMGSGLDAFSTSSPLAHVAQNTLQNATRLIEVVGGGVAATSLLLAGTVVLASGFGSRARAGPRIALLLAVAATLHLGWWIVASPGRTRYLLIGLFYLAGALSVFAATGSPRNRLGVLLMLAIGVSPNCMRAPSLLAPWPPFAPSNRTLSMLEVSDWLNASDPEPALVAGWWPHVADLQYLMAGRRVFLETVDLPFDRVDGAYVFINERWYPNRFRPMRPFIANFIHLCGGRLAMERHPYYVYRCELGAEAAVGVAATEGASKCFDESWYLSQHPDVSESTESGETADAFDHWMRYGRLQGWSPLPPGYPPEGCASLPHDVTDCFDEAYYLEAYPDIAKAVERGAFDTGYRHWMLFGSRTGWRRGFDPDHPPADCAVAGAR